MICFDYIFSRRLYSGECITYLVWINFQGRNLSNFFAGILEIDDFINTFWFHLTFIMFTFIGGAGWLQVRLPSNRKFLLNLDPCRLNRNWESRNSKEFLLQELLSDCRASKGDFISVSVLSKLFRILRQSLKFLDSAKYVLKLVHQASTPENRKTFLLNVSKSEKIFSI